MRIHAMIAEDERLAREELAFLLSQESDIILCPSAENGAHLLELNRQYRPDVIFMDIHMPIMTGMEAAQQLVGDPADSRLPLIVFTTAFDDYAVQAFGLEAVDYLLKPYDPNRLKETVARVRKRIRQLREEPRKERPFTLSKLLIEEGEKLVMVSPQMIVYAVREERSIVIHSEKERIQTKMTLQELEKKLGGPPFFRPHRSYLVNLDYVHEITPWFNGAYNLILKDPAKTKIPVSRSAARVLFSYLQP